MPYAAIAVHRVLRFDPNHVPAIFHQGLLLAHQQRHREAIASFRRVGELEPSSEYARRAFREARVVQHQLDVSAGVVD